MEAGSGSQYAPTTWHRTRNKHEGFSSVLLESWDYGLQTLCALSVSQRCPSRNGRRGRQSIGCETRISKDNALHEKLTCMQRLDVQARIHCTCKQSTTPGLEVSGANPAGKCWPGMCSLVKCLVTTGPEDVKAECAACTVSQGVRLSVLNQVHANY